MRSLARSALFTAFLGALPFSGCDCTEQPNANGEGEGEGDEGEGEGDLDAGPTGPPTEPIRPPNPDDPNNANLDSDCDGLSDLEEFSGVFAGGARTDPGDYDSDDDGIADGIEAGRDQVIDAECAPAGGTWLDADTATTTSPVSADTDGDCIPDGVEDTNKNGAIDPGESNPSSVDSDGDGILDHDEDPNCDGDRTGTETDPADADTDQDGLNDGLELTIGTDPNDSDSDDDGLLDGVDPDPLTAQPDSDHDGVPDDTDIAPTDPDRDDDGLCDGNLSVAGVCEAGEDRNGNGVVDGNESDPDSPDTDCDALADIDEQDAGTNPRLTDSDGDGLADGFEQGAVAAVANSGCAAPTPDSNPATHTDPALFDTDGDGMGDGLEDRDHDGAVDPANPGGVQDTDPNTADTDGDGRCDGSVTVAAASCVAGEDTNKNGFVDPGETNPRVVDDGGDDDSDGLTNTQEGQLGTDPGDDDTDNDGRLDGQEVNTDGTNPLSADTDCDGLSDGLEATAGTDPNDPDSDSDGIADGVETGHATQPAPNDCPAGFVGDQDTTAGHQTDPLDDDSDGDGVIDGAEDGNQNGRVDAGELNPNDPADVNPTITAACATPVVPGLFPNGQSDVLLALSPDFPVGNVAPITNSAGDEVGEAATDIAHVIAAFAVRTTPVGASSATHRQAIEAAIGGLTLPLTQDSLTSWDGFEMSRGTYTLANNGQDTGNRALALARSVLSDAGAATVFANVGGEQGPWKLALAVTRRSAQTAVVTVAITNLAQHDNPASGRDFRIEDIGGGTALGQVGDRIGTQCDVLPAQADEPVDFFFALDNSGSMGDEVAAVGRAVDQLTVQLGNSPLDFRITMVTTEFSQRTAGPTFAGNGQGTCTFGGTAPPGDRVCICELTNDLPRFQACVNTTTALGGSGAEGAYGPLREALTDVFLPATAVATPQKLRIGARVVAIVVTDAGEQTPQRTDRRDPYLVSPDDNPYVVGTTIQAKLAADIASSPGFWSAFFTGAAGAGGWDPAVGSNEPPLLVHGILCPFGANCDGEGDSTGPEAPLSDGSGNFRGESFARDRYYTVLQANQGVIGSVANATGATLASLDDISATITGIMNTVIGQVSPYPLSTDPIASTIKVAVEGPVRGPACDINNVPRSRVNGFAYDANTNSISFFGDCRPASPGTDVVISYRTWIDGSPDPDGTNCEPPFVVVGDQCLCPADCGTGAGLGAGQTCDAASCTIVCLDDCGGCTPGQQCDPTPPACGCACPADCNSGGTLPPGFVCDPATCLPTCAPGGCNPADRPVGVGWVCGDNCEWECAADCGDPTLSPTERCNLTTCTVECSADCNASCGGFTTCNNDPSVCACECVQSATCAPGFAFDPALCDCACNGDALACPATHNANLDECRCDCGADCNAACAPGSICQPSTCQCIPVGG